MVKKSNSDFIKRIKFGRFEHKHIFYRSFKNSNVISIVSHFSKKLSYLKKNSSIVRVTNRCWLTSRSQAVCRLVRLERRIWRREASFIRIVGYRFITH